jgi:DUF1680 family protein
MQQFDPSRITVAGPIGERIDVTWRGNFSQLDWDSDFIEPFIIKQRTGDYVGLGKTLDALVLMAAHTGDPQLIALKQHVVAALLDAQLPDGYIGAHTPETRITTLWDVHECAYLIYALADDARCFSEARSVEAAKRAADYLMHNLTGEMVTKGFEHSVLLDTLGLDRALLALHSITGQKRYLDFVNDTQQLAAWSLPIVEGRHGAIEGHAYAYLTRCVAQLELHDVTGDDRLLAQSNRVIDYLTRRGGMVITGAASQSECWHCDQDGSGELGETCATAYLIRLYDKLLRRTGDPKYGDLMERTIHNALFAAQSPDGRRIRYYAPFDGAREYWNRDTYCCPGNYRRIVAELPGMIYYRRDDGVVVNLLTASTLSCDLQPDLSVRIEQQTTYPADGHVRIALELSRPARFPIWVRMPAFTGEGGFVRFERDWRTTDAIDVQIDLRPRLVKGFAKQAGKAAPMYGPVVFSHYESHDGPIDLDADAAPHNDGHTLAAKLGGRGVILTRFAEPDGVATYFPPADPSHVVDDELLTHP